jgi:hypothetical protein
MGAVVQRVRAVVATAASRALGAPAMPRPVRRRDAIVESATVGPIALGEACSSLARQSALMAPVKLAMGADGMAALLAETPAGAFAGAEVWAALDAALSTAWDWLQADAGVDAREAVHDRRSGAQTIRAVAAGASPASGEPLADARIPELLRAAGWEWAVEEIGYRVRLVGEAPTLRVTPLAGDGLRVAVEAVPIRVASDASAQALSLFALDVNARLRLARVSVAIADDVARVGWDAVLWGGEGAGPSADWLNDAVEAVVGAHADTARAARAVASREVATAYLRARDPRVRVSTSAENGSMRAADTASG